jgi:hypothetical protein
VGGAGSQIVWGAGDLGSRGTFEPPAAPVIRSAAPKPAMRSRHTMCRFDRWGYDALPLKEGDVSGFVGDGSSAQA